MDVILTDTVGLLVAAIVVALLAQRLRLPYTVGLVAAGVALALVPPHHGLTLTHDVIFDVILPPLLFEAAINLHWAELRRDMVPVLVLALAGTLVATAVVAFGMTALLDWPLRAALPFGALIAATDPVAVIAMFKDNGVKGRLRLLVEAESLFNDGVAAVLFTLVLAWAQAATSVAPMDAAATLGWTVGGGIAIGGAVALAALAVAGRTADHLVEGVVTAVAAFGPFLLAEHLHASGVLATVASGLVVGTRGILSGDRHSRWSARGREFALALWDFIAFVANSVVFLLIGLSLAGLPVRQLGLGPLAVVIALVLGARALTVYPLCLPFAGSRWAVPLPAQHVLWWGGLRGALGLALALALPDTLPQRSEILIATFGVVAFSVVIQGLTMPLLLRRLNFVPRR